jgi:protein-S-isoprenylcysteine O-methyltransferase Ste14
VSTLLRSILALLIGAVIFVGLPVIGWGLTDFSGFVDHPARLGYIIVTILLQIFVVIRFPDVGHRSGKGKKLVRRQQLAVVLLQVISLAMVIAVPYSDRRDIAVIGGIDVIRYIGLVLFAAGFLMVSWSENVLGKQFSIQVTIQENHQLVTGGPYRLLRHPRYLGIIAFNAGIALVFHAWLGVILVAVLTLVLLWRIQDEEMLLHQEFGTEWDTYARKSWRLIPFVY